MANETMLYYKPYVYIRHAADSSADNPLYDVHVAIAVPVGNPEPRFIPNIKLPMGSDTAEYSIEIGAPKKLTGNTDYTMYFFTQARQPREGNGVTVRVYDELSLQREPVASNRVVYEDADSGGKGNGGDD